jgi:heat shock protein HslJ
VAAVMAATHAAAESDFPFGRELLLDVHPMKGSKRVPGLEIETNGTATIDLWCNSVQGQLVVAADTITIITGPMTQRQCPPDRAQGDESILAALNQVTNWRLEGDVLVLIGGTTMRYRLNTN